MKSKILIVTLAILLVLPLAIAGTITEFNVIREISDFVAGSSTSAIFSFEYPDVEENYMDAPLVVRINIISLNGYYPVWKKDFELQMLAEQYWLLGLIHINTIPMECREDAPINFHPKDKPGWLYTINEIPNGTFYCYNPNYYMMQLDSYDKIILNITSNPALYPGTYNVTVDLLEMELDTYPPTYPPKILNSGPNGTIVNSFTRLYVKTNKPATCKYDIVYKSDYDSMINEMNTIGNIEHYQPLTGLIDTQYNYYVLCEDNASNKMAYPASISFEVDTRENFNITIPEGKGDYLTLGWNQFFLPSFILDNTTLGAPYYVEDVLESIEGSYNMLYHYNGTDWASYVPGRVTDEGKPFNDLIKFNSGAWPYYIYMNATGRRIEIE